MHYETGPLYYTLSLLIGTDYQTIRTCPAARRSLLTVLWVGLFLLSTQLRTSAQSDPLHIWVGKLDRAAAEKCVGAHLTRNHTEKTR